MAAIALGIDAYVLAGVLLAALVVRLRSRRPVTATCAAAPGTVTA